MPIYGHENWSYLILPKSVQYGAYSKALDLLSAAIYFFEIGPNITELWAKNVCPYMGVHPIFDYILALKWSNFNIFTWDLFYMINRHKLHIIIPE